MASFTWTTTSRPAHIQEKKWAIFPDEISPNRIGYILQYLAQKRSGRGKFELEKKKNEQKPLPEENGRQRRR